MSLLMVLMGMLVGFVIAYFCIINAQNKEIKELIDTIEQQNNREKELKTQLDRADSTIVDLRNTISHLEAACSTLQD